MSAINSYSGVENLVVAKLKLFLSYAHEYIIVFTNWNPVLYVECTDRIKQILCFAVQNKPSVSCRGFTMIKNRKVGGWPIYLPPGHLPPGYQNIIAKGYSAIRRQAQDWLDEHEGNIMGDDIGKYMFYKAATVACDGAITLTRRYADLARELSEKAADPEKKAEYAIRDSTEEFFFGEKSSCGEKYFKNKGNTAESGCKRKFFFGRDFQD